MTLNKTVSILLLLIVAMASTPALASAQGPPENFRERIDQVTFGFEQSAENQVSFKPLELIESNRTNMSEQARQRLMQVSETFRERHRNRLNCTGNCYYQARQVEGNLTEVSENKPVRVLGIRATAREFYTVDDQGEIQSQRQNLFELLRGLGLARQVSAEQSEI